MPLSGSDLRRLLPPESIQLAAVAGDRDDAIRKAGALLVEAGSVGADYVDRMLERERAVSTFVGDGVAMPHGTLQAKSDVLAEGLSLLRLATPIDWGGQPVTVVIGIAAHDRRYIALLSQLASVLLEDGAIAELEAATTAEAVYDLLSTDSR